MIETLRFFQRFPPGALQTVPVWLSWLYGVYHYARLQRQTHNPSEKMGQTGCTLEVVGSNPTTGTLILYFYLNPLVIETDI